MPAMLRVSLLRNVPKLSAPPRIERAPRLDPVAAHVRALEMAAGDAVADGEIRATAADGEAGQQIETELIIEPAREPAGVVGEVGAADACFARQVERAIKAGKPRPPARLVGRGRGHLLEGWMVRHLGLFGRGILQRLAGKRDAVDVDGLSVTPERAPGPS